jgi:cytoskeletal protein CcmA (bactofilin family)
MKKMEKSNSKGHVTMIDDAAVVEGNLIAPHSVRIDGKFKGTIETSELITIGSSGVVEADIKAKSAIIGGKVIGNVTVEDRVELESHASLIGDLCTRDLVINEGAVFHGSCAMEKSKGEKV